MLLEPELIQAVADAEAMTPERVRIVLDAHARVTQRLATQDIRKQISAESGVPVAAVRRIMDRATGLAHKEIEWGKPVPWPGIGTLTVMFMCSRPNLKVRGNPHPIGPRTRIRFVPAIGLRNAAAGVEGKDAG